MYEVCTGLAFSPTGFLVHVFPTKIQLIKTKRNSGSGHISLHRETIVLEEGVTAFYNNMCTLIQRLVEMVVLQLTSGAQVTEMLITAMRLRGVKPTLDTHRTGVQVCDGCFSLPHFANASVLLQGHGCSQRLPPWET